MKFFMLVILIQAPLASFARYEAQDFSVRYSQGSLARITGHFNFLSDSFSTSASPPTQSSLLGVSAFVKGSRSSHLSFGLEAFQLSRQESVSTASSADISSQDFLLGFRYGLDKYEIFFVSALYGTSKVRYINPTSKTETWSGSDMAFVAGLQPKLSEHWAVEISILYCLPTYQKDGVAQNSAVNRSLLLPRLGLQMSF